MDRWLPREARMWVYGVSIVLMPLLVFYGIVSEAAAPLWIALVGGVFVPGLALGNLTPKKEAGDDSAG